MKLRPETLLGILLGTGVLVLLPESSLTKLGLLAFVSQFRGWLGGAFVLSSALLLGNGLSAVLRQGGRWISEIKESKARQKSFQYLSPPEKALLARYVNDNNTTHYFDISDGIANGLEAKGFIYRASNVGAHYKTFAFNIQYWAWKCLHDNPRLVTDKTVTTGK